MRTACSTPALGFAILTAVVFAAQTDPASAVPAIGGGFLRAAGMRLEDFVNCKQTWKQDAKLEGKWEVWNDPAVTDREIELLKLSLSANVFGIPASEVTVQRRDGRAFQFRVVFQSSSPGEAEKFAQTVRANAAAWSGGDRSSASLQARATEIRWEEADDGSISAIFTPRK